MNFKIYFVNDLITFMHCKMVTVFLKLAWGWISRRLEGQALSEMDNIWKSYNYKVVISPKQITADDAHIIRKETFC